MNRNSQGNRKFNGRRADVPDGTAAAGRASPRGIGTGSVPAGAEPLRRRREISSEELFGRQPFAHGREPRYFGTGVPGYESGPGFTGGYYGYGEEAPEIPTELEREYAYDLYGDGPDGGSAPAASKASPGAAPGMPRGLKPVPKYPPGPKGYQRTDQRMREDICDQLMRTGHIDSSDVTVEVSGAKVQLEGSVPVRWMKHIIENLADACPGVQEIENRISVKKPPRGA